MSEPRDDGWEARESVLESVEIFRRGAEIVRSVALVGSEQRVRVGGLPLELDDGSVRIEVEGGAIVRSFRVAFELAGREGDPLHAEPEELRELHRKIRGLVLELEELRARHARTAGLAIPERPARDHGRPPPPAPDRARLELLELRFALQREARERTQALELEKRDLERTARRLADEHARRTADAPSRHRVLKSIAIELAESAPASAVLHVAYRVRSARWAPSYRLSFDTRTGRAHLTMRAVVAQRTGEDWRGAELSVSTARMDGWYDLPELASLRIGRAQPAPRTGYRALPADGGALFADHDRGLPSARLAPLAQAPVTRAAQPVPAPAMVPTMTFAAVAPMSPMAPPVAGGPPGAPTGAPYAGPPPPAPAAPMPRQAMAEAVAAPQSMARAKSGGLMANLLGGLGGGGGALAEEGASADAYQAAAGAPLPPTSPTRALLDFGSLRLAAPEDPRRGTLRALERDERAKEAGLPPDAIVAALSALAAREAEMSALAPPAQHTYPDSLFGFDHRYAARGRADVPSDGAFHTLAITDAEGPASLLHVSVPREEPGVFRTLELACPLEGAVLRGPVDVYLDGSLAVSGSLSPTPAKGRIRVGMGLDESVKVARNVRFREESAGLMGGSSSLVHELELEARNNGPRPVRLEIRERLPVLAKGEEEIEIRPGKVSPPWQELAQTEPPLEGGRRWEIELASGAVTSLSAEYAIRISAKHELVGGNRRE